MRSLLIMVHLSFNNFSGKLLTLRFENISYFCRRNKEAELLMYETSAEPDTPRISVVSTVVNQPVIQPFLFCNYRHHPDNLEAAHYLSTCDVKGWEAIMASTAAPGYFEEVKLGNFVHQVKQKKKKNSYILSR